jgi:hypothetical protein
MGEDMRAGSGNEAGTEAGARLETHFVESGVSTRKMTPRGRLVAEVFDCLDGSVGPSFPRVTPPGGRASAER